MKNSSFKWSLWTLVIISVVLGIVSISTIIIDPFFHYHAPLNDIAYRVSNERYQNNGIIRHFDYDAIITGTSMTQNFKTSEMNELFGTQAIKIPFAGASYKEINDNIKTAISINEKLCYVVRGLDYNSLLKDKDEMRYDEYPEYLYDNIWWNDVSYVLNKDVCKEIGIDLYRTIMGLEMTSWDEYNNWDDSVQFGKAAIDKTYTPSEKVESMEDSSLSDLEKTMVCENIMQNVTSLAAEHPEVTFYLFFTPYSIYYWDTLWRNGQLEKQLEAERLAVEMMLQYDNIKLFSFFDDYDLICDLNNYKDILHYSEEVNSQILLWMHDGKHQLTKNNYDEYYKAVRDFYMSYSYDGLF